MTIPVCNGVKVVEKGDVLVANAASTGWQSVSFNLADTFDPDYHIVVMNFPGASLYTNVAIVKYFSYQLQPDGNTVNMKTLISNAINTSTAYSYEVWEVWGLAAPVARYDIDAYVNQGFGNIDLDLVSDPGGDPDSSPLLLTHNGTTFFESNSNANTLYTWGYGGSTIHKTFSRYNADTVQVYCRSYVAADTYNFKFLIIPVD